jgi:hypothetical protein
VSTDYYRPVSYTSIEKVKADLLHTVTPSIRAYCVQSGERWALQVRGPLKLASGKDGVDSIIAHAVLKRDQVEELIRALETLLNEDLARAIDTEFAKSLGEGAPRSGRLSS